VQAFRRSKSPEKTVRLKLRGLDSSALYTVTNLDTGNTCKLKGLDLEKEGLLVEISEAPSSAVITYKR
jgi:hypothetical protein